MSAIWTVEPLDERGKEGWSAPSALALATPARPRVALTFARVSEILRRITKEEWVVALRERVIPIAWSPGHASFAAGAKSARRAAQRGIALDAVIDDATLLGALQREKDADLRRIAVSTLADRGSEYSASVRMTRAQSLAGVAFAAVAIAGLTLLTGITATLLGLACALFFLLVIGLKFMTLWPVLGASDPPVLPDDELPAYSVLVPLFRETEVAAQLLRALFSLDYPRDRLDIKLILEASDLATRALIRDEELPDHMEVIVVPACGPQTKPKALNYALQFARGDMITVFDAEDQPDSDELRVAAETFVISSADCACLQARLRFHNPRENWLTNGIMAQTPPLAEQSASGGGARR